MTLEELNQVSRQEAAAALTRCCGAVAWVERMCAARPFADRAALMAAAARAFASLGPDDWREALAAHPRIGEREDLRRKFADTAVWAGDEQHGASAASAATRAALAEGNRAYQEKFGYIFVVCATGRSADEMLALLRQRLGHDPAVELGVAAEEQMRITALRLDKLLEEAS